MHRCVSVSEFVRTISSTIVVGFQSNLTQLFSITCRCTIWNIHSGRPKVKVTLEGQFFVWKISTTILDLFQYKFSQLFFVMSRYAQDQGQRSRSRGLDMLSLDNRLGYFISFHDNNVKYVTWCKYSCWTVTFYAPASRDRGHIVLPVSVCLLKT